MRLLLVEDEPGLGAAVKQVLSESESVVDWVVNGAEAWDY